MDISEILHGLNCHGGFLMVKRYLVRLSQEEASLLRDIVKKLKGTSQKKNAACKGQSEHCGTQREIYWRPLASSQRRRRTSCGVLTSI